MITRRSWLACGFLTSFMRPSIRRTPQTKNFKTGEQEPAWNVDLVPLKRVARGDFQLGPIDDDSPAATLVCRQCGTDKFLVGQSSTPGHGCTVAKCPKCGWERTIHGV